MHFPPGSELPDRTHPLTANPPPQGKPPVLPVGSVPEPGVGTKSLLTILNPGIAVCGTHSPVPMALGGGWGPVSAAGRGLLGCK